MRRSFLAFSLAVAAGLFGCATPYSQVTGERYFRSQIDTYDLKVVAVDGAYPQREPALVEPGMRQITVRAAPTPVQASGTEKTVPLDVKPCTRYYLVAVKPTRLATDFEVRVDHQIPVPNCERAP